MRKGNKDLLTANKFTGSNTCKSARMYHYMDKKRVPL